MRFCVHPATVDQLALVVQQGAAVVHFSGHGHEVTGSLVFEDHQGAARMLAPEFVSKLNSCVLAGI